MRESKRVLSKYDGKKYGWWKDGKKFVVLVIAVFLIFRFVIGFSFVSGHSMDDTLHDGELVVYSRIVSAYERGDIVSVRVPSGEYYVKRVIAVGGDEVEVRDGDLYINGELQEEDYVDTSTEEAKDSAVLYPYTVEEGDVWVMGDNREVSVDSRTFGAVNTSQIKGKLILHAGKFYIKKL